jgi:hypothetical protein
VPMLSGEEELHVGGGEQARSTPAETLLLQNGG